MNAGLLEKVTRYYIPHIYVKHYIRLPLQQALEAPPNIARFSSIRKIFHVRAILPFLVFARVLICICNLICIK